MSRPLSWIPSCSGWDRTRVLPVRIWTVVIIPWPPLCGVVLFMQRGTGMAFDQTEVLVRSVQHACSCQSRHTEPRSISLRPAPGVMMGERSRVFRATKVGEGIVADPGLGVGSVCSS
jgi:hypothetical protein